ncbi:Putative succinate-semialdehyde dehydrogenase C1002.12c [NADP(+)] [Seminavis robusta]|uniref:Succinate-semialdehyde dehydrogenase, mitochondrial n=1 Tax=Seminavis robusta TaxID=568900 RepID=A0A9N8ENI4_9STRA|nr:Putative succinate-semialdehyde dehydrogenase C1002.12c [NADP(+)] [Seminavis robusta]|eukprot:Sro1473_g275570.1 Putative succinate-semialdehyde dehydrogenase C1002.12c [NADP(+)] (532) ;mRNA; r:2668-4346
MIHLSQKQALMLTLMAGVRPWSRAVTRALSTSAPVGTSAAAASLLKNPSLLAVASGKSLLDVFNPAKPDEIVGQVPIQGGEETRQAIERSYHVLPSWRDGTTASFRSNLLSKWSGLIQENADDLAIIMTLESGKPLAESRGEVNYATSFLDFYAAEAVRSTGAGGGFMIPTPFATTNGAPRGQIMAKQQAVGVTGLITPWNFPIAMITRKVGPALAAGCTAIVKPSELTPLTAVALQNLAEQAGIPENVLQLITTDKSSTPQVGGELCTNPLVRKLSFTGSTAVGKLLMKQSSDTVKRLSLELGGNAPFVVFDDADIDQAVTAAMASKFRNAGQTCVCADRFLVHAAVHDEFVDKFVAAAQKLVVGPGLDKETTMGPMIVADAVTRTHQKVQEALERDGATCALGGSPMEDLGPHFYQPTILTGVSPESSIWKTETFGPVAPIIKFDVEEEALRLANDSDVGLASYFCTRDLSRAFRFSEQLECGIVGLNDGIISSCAAPFGGIKESGLGREGSSLGIAEYLETKYIFMNT